MAWIKRTVRKDGSRSYWVMDIRDGRYVVIAEAKTQMEADLRKEQYEIRRDLEKEGYGDKYEALLDQVWGPKSKVGKP